jgi:hypothetical protein
MTMKIFLLTILLATLTGGAALADGYNNRYAYGSCANNNSKACRDARDAFARHHNGQSPEQYNNAWYQGQQGRWNQNGANWQWRGIDGNEYRRGNKGWQWSGARRDRDHDRE